MGEIANAREAAAAVRAEGAKLGEQMRAVGLQLGEVQAAVNASPDEALEVRAAALRATLARLRELVPEQGKDTAIGRKITKADELVARLEGERVGLLALVGRGDALERRWAGRLGDALRLLRDLRAVLAVADRDSYAAELQPLAAALEGDRAIIAALPKQRARLVALGE